jgi:hypothetical protein
VKDRLASGEAPPYHVVLRQDRFSLAGTSRRKTWYHSGTQAAPSSRGRDGVGEDQMAYALRLASSRTMRFVKCATGRLWADRLQFP